MAVYVDNMQAKYGRMTMCHMLADTEEELESMAIKIGVKLKWWQHKGTYRSHFDICSTKRRDAINNGAIEVSFRQVGLMLKARKVE